MLWNVTITRTAVASRDIEVEADTREQAEAKALEQAGDLDYSGCVVDYDFDVAGSTPVNAKEENNDLPMGYRYLNMGEIVQGTDKRWETPSDNPGLAEAGMEAQWVEVPSVCIGEVVDNPREYIRQDHSGEEVNLASEEKRCPDLAPDELCAICCKTVFPDDINAAIDAGWFPSYFIGDEEQGGPVCPHCTEQFLAEDPQHGESVLAVKGKYVSVWDGGVEVKSPCTVNPITREVSIEHASDVEGLETMEREYVVLNRKEYEACNLEEWEQLTPEEWSRMFYWD